MAHLSTVTVMVHLPPPPLVLKISSSGSYPKGLSGLELSGVFFLSLWFFAHPPPPKKKKTKSLCKTLNKILDTTLFVMSFRLGTKASGSLGSWSLLRSFAIFPSTSYSDHEIVINFYNGLVPPPILKKYLRM